MTAFFSAALRQFAVLELAEKVIVLTGFSSKIVFKPLPSDDPRQCKPGIALANAVLEWTPQISLEEGLRKTRSHLSTRLSL